MATVPTAVISPTTNDDITCTFVMRTLASTLCAAPVLKRVHLVLFARKRLDGADAGTGVAPALRPDH